jgi:hypothetical protein
MQETDVPSESVVDTEVKVNLEVEGRNSVYCIEHDVTDIRRKYIIS